MVGYHRSRYITAKVHALPSVGVRNDSPSSSQTSRDEIAWANPALWIKLNNQRKASSKSWEDNDGDEVDLEPDSMSIAIEWPDDRRLGKGKSRNLVVWVTPAATPVSRAI